MYEKLLPKSINFKLNKREPNGSSGTVNILCGTRQAIS